MVTTALPVGFDVVWFRNFAYRVTLSRMPAPVYVPPVRPPNPYDPLAFDRPLVNAIVPPLVIAFAVLVTLSPLGFLLTGFHIWVHEFGHATVAWLTGKRALPLPIGWTNISPEKSLFVYVGVLALLAVLFAAGWKERKLSAIVAAMAIAVLQFYLTWMLPAEPARMWVVFGGVGGEFYLAAAMIGLFYFELPEKFKWGACRYVFLFIGASSFFQTYVLWKKILHGTEGIPYGSMVNGEDDASGDMNTLHEDFNWTQHDIIHRYNHLADACVIGLAIVYLVFVLRLDVAARKIVRWGEAGDHRQLADGQ